jgi:serine/threonine protein kinase
VSDQYTAGSEVFGGRYRLERIIGTGGMAIVWCATDQRLGRRVAIKVIADTLAADPAYVERFAREARTAAGLSHPHLVSVYDYAASASQPFLVMELVEGGTLADRIARGPVDAHEARALAADLTAALGCVHEAGILHRDIKPANVLVGRDGRARLTDFGIAQPEDATRLTRPGDVIGTIRYLAPEVLAGGAPSVQSDLYALGVLVRELVGENADPALRAFVERLTAADPAARPAGAGAALALLELPTAAPAADAADADTQVQRPDGATRPTPRRHIELRLTPRVVIAGAVAAMLLALVVLSLGGSDEPGAPPTTTRATTPPAAAAAPIRLEQRVDQLDELIRRAAG